jgi:hypothetical protein
MTIENLQQLVPDPHAGVDAGAHRATLHLWPRATRPVLHFVDDLLCPALLWIIPVTPAEALLAKDRGVDCLEERLEAAHFNYLDGERPSVV